MNTYERIFNILIEGKEKQADIESDKELTRAGASSSSDPKSKRYSPSLHTMHNSPENIVRRKHSVVIRRSDRSNQRHADDVARGKDEKRQRDQAAIDRANAAEKKRKRAGRVAAGLQSPPGQKMSKKTRRNAEKARKK